MTRCVCTTLEAGDGMLADPDLFALAKYPFFLSGPGFSEDNFLVAEPPTIPCGPASPAPANHGRAALPRSGRSHLYNDL